MGNPPFTRNCHQSAVQHDGRRTVSLRDNLDIRKSDAITPPRSECFQYGLLDGKARRKPFGSVAALFRGSQFCNGEDR